MDHCEHVFGFVDALVSTGFIVVVLETKLKVQFSLKSVKDPIQVIAPAEGSPDMLLFLFH